MPYIGVSPSNGVRRVHTYTATASQTTFSGAGAEGTSLSYKDSNFVDVYQNGIKLGDADYTSTSGTSIVLAQGASADDLVVVVVFDVFSVADTVSKADGGTFDGNVTMGGTLGVTGASTLTGALSAKGGAVFNEDSADVDFRVESNGNANMLFVDGGDDAVVIGHNASRTTLFNTTATAALQIEGTSGNTASMSIVRNSNDDNGPQLVLGKSNGTTNGAVTVVTDDALLGRISFQGADGTQTVEAGRIECLVDDTPGADDMPGRLVFSTTANGASSPTEHMRIHAGGNVTIGTANQSPAESSTATGLRLGSNGGTQISTSGLEIMRLNRNTNDGTLINFCQGATSEGHISISGTTVTYNGGHLGRWSQLENNTRDNTIVKGTVMTNLDQMAEWTTDGVTEDNEQLNCMAVSSVEGDANVAGVFVNWDNDDDVYTNDMNVAMTGDMVIRIAQGTTVARGDLLMSAGDGTAKPQGDDIVRSKTIAKVTSTNVSHTYDDGTYLVPCVLMAC